MWSRALWTLQWNSGRYGGALLIFFTEGSKCCDFKRVICLSFARFLTFSLGTRRKLHFFSTSIVDTLCCLSNKTNEIQIRSSTFALDEISCFIDPLSFKTSPPNFINSTFGRDGPCLIPCAIVSKLLTAVQRSVTKERGTGTAFAKVGLLWNKRWVDFSCCCS